jgi:hypothetical protein
MTILAILLFFILEGEPAKGVYKGFQTSKGRAGAT